MRDQERTAREELANLRNKYESLSKVPKLDATPTTADNEIVVLGEDATKLQVLTETSEHKVNALKESQSTSENLLSATHAKIASLESEIETLRLAHARQEVTIADMSDQATSKLQDLAQAYELKINALMERYGALEELLAEARSENAVLESKIGSTQTSQAKRGIALTEISQEKTNLERKVEELMTQLFSREATLESLRTQQTELDRRLSTEAFEYKRDLALKDDHIASQENKIIQTEFILKEQAANISAATTLCADLQSMLQKLDDQVGNLKSQLANRDARITTLDSALAVLRENNDDLRRVHRDELAELTTVAAQQSASMKAVISELEHKLRTSEQERRSSATILADRIRHLENERCEITAQLQQEIQKIPQSDQKVKDLEEQLSALKHTHSESLESAQKSHSEALLQLQDAIGRDMKRAESQITELESKYTIMIAAHEKELGNLKSMHQSEIADVEDSRSAELEYVKDMVETTKAEIKGLHFSLNAANDTIASIELDKQLLQQSHAEEIKNLQGQKQDQEQSLQNLSATLTSLTRKNSVLQDEYDALSVKAAAAESKLTLLEFLASSETLTNMKTESHLKQNYILGLTPGQSPEVDQSENFTGPQLPEQVTPTSGSPATMSRSRQTSISSMRRKSASGRSGHRGNLSSEFMDYSGPSGQNTPAKSGSAIKQLLRRTSHVLRMPAES